MPRAVLRALALLTASGIGMQAHALVVAITPGPKSLYLQVGAGTITGGDFSSGGTPATTARSTA